MVVIFRDFVEIQGRSRPLEDMVALNLMGAVACFGARPVLSWMLPDNVALWY